MTNNVSPLVLLLPHAPPAGPPDPLQASMAAPDGSPAHPAAVHWLLYGGPGVMEPETEVGGVAGELGRGRGGTWPGPLPCRSGAVIRELPSNTVGRHPLGRSPCSGFDWSPPAPLPSPWDVPRP